MAVLGVRHPGYFYTVAPSFSIHSLQHMINVTTFHVPPTTRAFYIASWKWGGEGVEGTRARLGLSF